MDFRRFGSVLRHRCLQLIELRAEPLARAESLPAISRLLERTFRPFIVRRAEPARRLHRDGQRIGIIALHGEPW